jgi:hypothetical protein
MTGSSDGLIRFWENEGDVLWIVNITVSVLLHLLLNLIYEKNVRFGLFVHKASIPFISRAKYSELCCSMSLFDDRSTLSHVMMDAKLHKLEVALC